MQHNFSKIPVTILVACLTLIGQIAFAQTPEEDHSSNLAQVGVALSEEEIQSYLSDRTIDGCYPYGEAFSERTSSDGRVFEGNVQAGVWKTDGRLACYKYDGESDFTCMQIFKTNTGYFFFHPSVGIVAWDDEEKCAEILSSKK
ncbi:MAG: hypothetical protein AAFR00_08695 [Pseudomonadota bacterium]